MAKSKLFSSQSLLVTVKAIVVSILVAILPMILRFVNLGIENAKIVYIIAGLWMIFSLFLWGYLAQRFWNWK